VFAEQLYSDALKTCNANEGFAGRSLQSDSIKISAIVRQIRVQTMRKI